MLVMQKTKLQEYKTDAKKNRNWQNCIKEINFRITVSNY